VFAALAVGEVGFRGPRVCSTEALVKPGEALIPPRDPTLGAVLFCAKVASSNSEKTGGHCRQGVGTIVAARGQRLRTLPGEISPPELLPYREAVEGSFGASVPPNKNWDVVWGHQRSQVGTRNLSYHQFVVGSAAREGSN